MVSWDLPSTRAVLPLALPLVNKGSTWGNKRVQGAPKTTGASPKRPMLSPGAGPPPEGVAFNGALG
jgi:hypothetical protein